MDMHCLYDSDQFVVVHIAPGSPGDGFEIVNKPTERTAYLTGPVGEAFRQQVIAWAVNVPEQDEVDDTLAQFSTLNTNPLVMH